LTDIEYMRLAIEQALLARDAGEVPIGALITRDGEVVATAHNRNILEFDPSAHAEIACLREAGQVMENHRLTGCTLFVTIEPCAMCAGALVHARIKRLVFGAFDPKAGAVRSVMQVLDHPALNHRIEVTAGVLAEECSGLLQTFFREKRSAQA
jgi:tRNA(adenine34) deaminase